MKGIISHHSADVWWQIFQNSHRSKNCDQTDNMVLFSVQLYFWTSAWFPTIENPITMILQMFPNNSTMATIMEYKGFHWKEEIKWEYFSWRFREKMRHCTSIHYCKFSVALIQKPVDWFAVQISWLVSIWGQLWYLMG